MNIIIKGVSHSLCMEMLESSIDVVSMVELEEKLYTLQIRIKEDVMLLTNGKQVILYFERRLTGLKEKSIILNREDFIDITID